MLLLEASAFLLVIPAKAGIQRLQTFSHERHWIPAFAGMTVGGVRRSGCFNQGLQAP
ncbi:hypothetical protein [Lysobacter gummosus]|uniref:hypothetical protein n=1 Tax=Lysobacter gummosus TaxID=262324 RepID=UPI0036405D1A